MSDIDDESDRADMALGPNPTVAYRGERVEISIDRTTRCVNAMGRGGRMNLLELRLAKHRLDLTDDQALDAALSPVGPIIVGEAPGENTSRWLPMFPFPAGSAGGRFLKFSAMSAADYLRTFHRVNLVREWTKRWDEELAVTNAVRLRLLYRGHPMVLLGARVKEAFERAVTRPNHRMDMDAGAWFLSTHGWMNCLPHPSGRSHAYNDPARVKIARQVLWEAANLWHRPTHGGVMRSEASCQNCGKLASTHPSFGPDRRYKLMCVGDPDVYRTAF